MHVLRVDVHERGKDYPVVRHEFRGETKGQALRFLAAHMRADAFLRQCTKEQRYGAVRCRIRRAWLEE
jgi:hypothetical protein